MFIYNSIFNLLSEDQLIVFGIVKNILFVLSITSSIYLLFGVNKRIKEMQRVLAITSIVLYTTLVLMGYMIIVSFVPIVIGLYLFINRKEIFIK